MYVSIVLETTMAHEDDAAALAAQPTCPFTFGQVLAHMGQYGAALDKGTVDPADFQLIVVGYDVTCACGKPFLAHPQERPVVETQAGTFFALVLLVSFLVPLRTSSTSIYPCQSSPPLRLC